MRAFIRRHLDPSTRLGEAMFGLIMALGITGAVRISSSQSTNRELFVAILGCNLAWGVVDGVMFALLALFERARKYRIVKLALNSPSDEVALEGISRHLASGIAMFSTGEERNQICRLVLEAARRAKLEPPRLHLDDLLGAVAVGLMVIVASLPVLMPFLIFAKPIVAARISNLVGLGMLFCLGHWWGRMVDANPLRIGTGLTAVGFVLVMITIALGG
jgi:hypothetical protein